MKKTPLETELLHCLKFLWDCLADGTLVRNISKDHEPGWIQRTVKFVAELKLAEAAIERAELLDEPDRRHEVTQETQPRIDKLFFEPRPPYTAREWPFAGPWTGGFSK